MTTAYEMLLESQTTEDSTANVSDVCLINPDTRLITVPETLVIGGVESDKNSERIKFSCPKVVGDNLDLQEFQIRINFRNISAAIPQ